MTSEVEWKQKKINASTCVIISAITLFVGVFIGLGFTEYAENLGFKKSTTKTEETFAESGDWSDLNEVYSLLKKNYDGKIEKSALIEGAKKGLTEALGDVYTVYMDAEEAKEFNDSLHGEVGGGIGIEFAE